MSCCHSLPSFTKSLSIHLHWVAKKVKHMPTPLISWPFLSVSLSVFESSEEQKNDSGFVSLSFPVLFFLVCIDVLFVLLCWSKYFLLSLITSQEIFPSHNPASTRNEVLTFQQKWLVDAKHIAFLQFSGTEFVSVPAIQDHVWADDHQVHMHNTVTHQTHTHTHKLTHAHTHYTHTQQLSHTHTHASIHTHTTHTHWQTHTHTHWHPILAAQLSHLPKKSTKVVFRFGFNLLILFLLLRCYIFSRSSRNIYIWHKGQVFHCRLAGGDMFSGVAHLWARLTTGM